MATEQTAFRPPEQEIVVELPIKVMGWRVLVRPFRPKPVTDGGIVLAEETLQNAEILTNVGQVIAMGNTCFKAITRAGINMAEIDPIPKVGDWIMYGSYGGQQFFTKGGLKYTIINDDSIMGVVPDPHIMRSHV